jgi:hypothetical protein
MDFREAYTPEKCERLKKESCKGNEPAYVVRVSYLIRDGKYSEAKRIQEEKNKNSELPKNQSIYKVIA